MFIKNRYKRINSFIVEFKQNLIYQLIAYYALLYMPLINHVIGIGGIPLILAGCIIYIIIPLIFLIRTISRYKTWSLRNMGKVLLFSYIISYPVIHILPMEAFLAGHGQIDLEIFIYFGAIAGIFSFGGCVIGIIMNALLRKNTQKIKY